MEQDSLMFFKSPYEFNDFVNKLNIYNGWKIQKGLMNSRGKIIANKEYTRILINKFNEKDFFRKRVSLAEIVSWLDNLVLIQRLLVKLKKLITPCVYKDIGISVEYMIRMSKRMRIDYIIVYDNTYLLLEMRTVNDFEKIRKTWEKKFLELIIYKELMLNYLINKRIIVYALISLYEYSDRGRNEKHILNNNKQLDYLSNYIMIYLFNNSKT